MPVYVCLNASGISVCVYARVCTRVRGKEIARGREREKEEGRVITLALVFPLFVVPFTLISGRSSFYSFSFFPSQSIYLYICT